MTKRGEQAAAGEQQTSDRERGGWAVADKGRQQQREEDKEGIRRQQTCGDKERWAAGLGPGPMRRLNNQPQREEGGGAGAGADMTT